MLDWLACALVRIAGGLLCLLPPSAAVRLGEGLGDLARWLQPQRVRIGLQNLRAAFDGSRSPEELDGIIQRCYRQLGAGMIELLRLPVIDRAYVDRHVAIEGRAHFDRAIASGRPVILLTGHFGNWELSSIVAALLGAPIVALARAQERLPRLYRLLVSYRESKGCTIVHKGGAMKQLIAALERGRLVGIVGDQASRRGIPVEFFGRSAFFAAGPFELALRKRALILPVFIRRLHGPFHRIVVEPPLELDTASGRRDAVRQGVERFAEILSRRIREDPAQWLWMHRRWKHTTARRALVLSDGKLGHLKQALAVVDALRQRVPELTHQVVEVRYRSRIARAAALLWSCCLPRLGAARVLRLALASPSASAVLSRSADFVVSCGASAAPVNLLWSAENGAKSVVIMNPSPLPLSRFTLVIAPRHDRLPRRANVVQIDGAVVDQFGPERLRRAGERLRAHPRFRGEAARGTVAVLIGGGTALTTMPPDFAEALVAQVQRACGASGGRCLVTTSRRTGPAVERCLAERLDQDPRCALLLLAGRDALDGTLEGLLGSAEVIVVTGESISMVSEACASGRRVLVVEPPRAPTPNSALFLKPLARLVWGQAVMTKHQRFLRKLEQEGRIRIVTVPELSRAIQRALAEPSLEPLETFSAIRHAVARLL